MRDNEPDQVPEPPVVDVRDWPPRSRSDDAREQLDREAGTLGLGGGGEDAAAAADEPPIGGRGYLGTGAAGRGEDVITKGGSRGSAAEPGLPAETTGGEDAEG